MDEVEIYPMASFPTLTVRDIQASARWYVDALGFTHVFTMPGPGGTPSLVHLRWVKHADLLLFPDRRGEPDDRPKGVGVALNYACPDVDALAERARGHGAVIVEGPVDRPWNAREAVLLDPDGYRLVFYGPTAAGFTRSFDEIVASAATGFQA
jgi:catechol 2,3-dioxygenase-like lactoylglutathione lyase family enzyme